MSDSGQLGRDQWYDGKEKHLSSVGTIVPPLQRVVRNKLRPRSGYLYCTLDALCDLHYMCCRQQWPWAGLFRASVRSTLTFCCDAALCLRSFQPTKLCPDDSLMLLDARMGVLDRSFPTILGRQ